VTLDRETWQAARGIAELPDDDDAFQQRVAMLLERVASSGLIVPGAAAHLLDEPPKTFALLWRALRPMIERFYLTPTLQEVGDATGVSLRQVDRYVQEFVTSFALVGEGWRHATRHMRLKLAVLLLSADGASVADVARAVGYRSSDAMARAFRDADMPAPTAVQQQVRAVVR
jgi:AraC-like DNA-binding protein